MENIPQPSEEQVKKYNAILQKLQDLISEGGDVALDLLNELLTKIQVPTLLIWGENDTAVPKRIAKEMRQLIPGSELVVLDKLGHNALLDNPNIFYRSWQWNSM